MLRKLMNCVEYATELSSLRQQLMSRSLLCKGPTCVQGRNYASLRLR